MKKQANKNNKKAFTLIELLAVIIILGILMILAIPSVSKYINDSRKTTYINTAKSLAGGARNLIHSGKFKLDDKDTTYYIDGKCIKTDNAYRSPYGDFIKAYVVVTLNEDNYDYYWTSVDTTGTGVKGLINVDNLKIEDIEMNIENREITTNRGIDRRSKVVLIGSDCRKGAPSSVGTRVDGQTGNVIMPICKKATTQHTSTCERSAGIGCNALYEENATITYGTIPNGDLIPGNAFDCDINSDGVYDSETERFYYVKSEGDNRVLIYYTNINNQTMYAYDSERKNIYGPRIGYQYLPSTSDWNIPNAILPGTRNIVTEIGTTTTSGGTIESFTYTGKIARFLTAEEVNFACNITIGSSRAGELNNCQWLMENLGYFERTSGDRTYGYWLETPKSSSNYEAWCLDGRSRFVYKGAANTTTYCGVRPAITINKLDMEQ